MTISIPLGSYFEQKSTKIWDFLTNQDNIFERKDLFACDFLQKFRTIFVQGDIATLPQQRLKTHFIGNDGLNF